MAAYKAHIYRIQLSTVLIPAVINSKAVSYSSASCYGRLPDEENNMAKGLRSVPLSGNLLIIEEA